MPLSFSSARVFSSSRIELAKAARINTLSFGCRSTALQPGGRQAVWPGCGLLQQQHKQWPRSRVLLPHLAAMTGRGLNTDAGCTTLNPQQQLASQQSPFRQDNSSNSGLHNTSGVPLSFRDGTVAAAAGGPCVLQEAHSSLTLNPSESRDGALVFGVASQQGPMSAVDTVIGKLKFTRFLACARNKLWWMTPEWGSDAGQLPPETQFLLLELEEGGPYAVVLPLIDGDFRGTLRPVKGRQNQGEVCLRVESGDESVFGESWDSVLYVAAGTDPYELVDKGVAAAARLSGGARPLSQKTLPPSLDSFGWCTWDAFYSSVSARGLNEGLASLQAGGVTPRFLIIDDGWQMTDVDPPYGKAPTAQMAANMKITEGAGKDLQDMVESTQMDYYTESAKSLSKASQQLRVDQELINIMPTVANTGANPHPKANSSQGSYDGTWDAAEAVRPASKARGRGGRVEQQGVHRHGSSGPAAAEMEALQERRLADGDIDIGSASTKAAVAAEQGIAEQLMANPDVKKQSFLLVRLAQKAAGALVGLAMASFLIFYQWVIEPAPPASWRVKGFTKFAQGPLRGAMLMFYASASDFTRRLTDVRANGKFAHPDAGPEDDWEAAQERLGLVVSTVKERFGIKHVYCWHGLPAYWGGVMPGAPSLAGISPDSRIVYPKPTDSISEVEPSLLWCPAVLAGVGVTNNPTALYTNMHAYLQASNIDGVKVDCQAGVGLVGSVVGGGPATARDFHAALERSIQQHFPGNHAINCMCHSTENMYRFAHTAVARVSDDFYPRDETSITPHIAACAYNSLYMGALVQPDWDMFHSKHPAGRLHGMARAISGGAVYVSDKPGEHDFELLKALVLEDGSVLRALLPGRPTRDALFADPLRDGASLSKVWNTNRIVGVVGVFNLQGSCWDRKARKFVTFSKNGPALSTVVRPHDVETLRRAAEEQQSSSGGGSGGGNSNGASNGSSNGNSSDAASGIGASGAGANGAGRSSNGSGAGQRQYVAYSVTSGRVTGQLPGDGELPVMLERGRSDMYWFSPLLRQGGVGFAPLGLEGMFNGGGAIMDVSMGAGSSSGSSSRARQEANGSGRANGAGQQAVATVQVRGSGKLLMYASERPSAVWVNLAPRDFQYDEAEHTLRVNVPVLEDLRCEVEVMF